MSSVSSPLSSGGVIPFTGSSTYAADFQNVLNKAVERASQPMNAMQAQVTDLTSQEQAVAGLETTFTSLQNALQNIGSSASGSPAAQSSDTSAVTASASAGALN